MAHVKLQDGVTAAASEAGISLGQWVEQALKKKALAAEGLDPGVPLEEDPGAAAPGRGRCGITGGGLSPG